VSRDHLSDDVVIREPYGVVLTVGLRMDAEHIAITEPVRRLEGAPDVTFESEAVSKFDRHRGPKKTTQNSPSDLRRPRCNLGALSFAQGVAGHGEA
jgi:hypothetical protein